MARTALSRSPGEVDLTDGSDTAPIGTDPDDAILRHIVESAAYGYDDPEIRAASSEAAVSYPGRAVSEGRGGRTARGPRRTAPRR